MIGTELSSTNSRPPYGGYQETEVEWLGRVPLHWRKGKLKHSVTACQNGVWGDEPDGVSDIICVRVADFDRRSLRVRLNQPTLRSVTERERRGRVLASGDLLLEKSGGGDLQPVGAVVLYDRPAAAVCSNFVARMPVHDAYNPRFLAYLHAHLYDRRVNTRSIKQSIGIQNLTSDAYLDEIAYFPPLPEQRAIATFLDRQTAKIDQLIAKKERLIALLQEQRAAVITHAVTRGLDPNAPMKDSGVEWLGQVPAHWTVVRNKVLFREIDERSDTGTEELLSVSHITGVTSRSEKVVYMFKAESNVGYKRCRRDDLAVNTMWAYMGALGISPLDGIISPSYNVYRSRTADLLPAYFDLLCRMPPHIAEIDRMSKGVWRSRLRLYPDEFFEIRSPVPPIEEQKSLLEMVRDTDSRDADVRKSLIDSLEKLREYRSALISAAVTGKIDVRGEVE